MNMTRLAILVVLTFACGAMHAWAQTGPAGNAHPTPQTPDSMGSPNPFGEGASPDQSTPQDKHAFASSVNLEPLRDAAVSHNGRIKILDTLARETIRTIAGRADYIDYVPEFDEDGQVSGVTKLHYDPLFTYLDLLASPSYYFDKPLVHVAYLPTRRALIEVTVEDPSMQERWMKLTRLSPAMLNQGFRTVAETRGVDQDIARSLGQLDAAADLLRFGHNNLLLVAPFNASGAWRHVSSLPQSSPIRQRFEALGAAWRDGDAEQVNAHIAEIAVALETANGEASSAGRRSIEAMYNKARPFEFGAWLYLVAFVSLLLAFGTQWKAMYAIGLGALVGAVLAHTLGFAARWVIAERLPIQNQFESMTGLALGGALVGLTIMVTKRQWLFGAAAAAVGFLILLAATQTGVPGASIGREAAILNTSWLLKYHVSTVLVSYGLITLGAVMSAFYLVLHYFGGRSTSSTDDLAAFTTEGLNLESGAAAGRTRLLNDLDRAQMTVLQLAFWTLAVGILLGAWWADHSWGRWWAFDPKETWALLTWIVYLIVIHLRFATSGNRGLVTAWLSVAGFIVMLWTYFGVNLLLPGLHAYA